MKVYFLLLPLFILSCNKSADSNKKDKETTEQQCFILNEGANYDQNVKPVAKLTHAEILKNLPAHIQMKEATDFAPFNYDLK